MRITFMSGYAGTLSDLERVATELSRRQQEVSTGKRVTVPSDDPGSMAASVRERAEIAAVDQFSLTTDNVSSRMMVADTVLSDLVTKFTAARSTTVAAQGTIQTSSQREATANELAGLRDAIYDDINTTFRGTYLFSGSKGSTAPYTKAADGTVSSYNGDTTPMLVDIDRGRTMQTTFVGSDISQGVESEDIFVSFAKLIEAVRTGDQTAMATGLDKVQKAFDRVVRVQSGVGANLNSLETAQTRLSSIKQSNAARLSKDEDADMAESITAMQQANTAYQSALGVVGARSKLTLLDYLK
jgi:flagellar hook-associated protein 3 FlgL